MLRRKIIVALYASAGVSITDMSYASSSAFLDEPYRTGVWTQKEEYPIYPVAPNPTDQEITEVEAELEELQEKLAQRDEFIGRFAAAAERHLKRSTHALLTKDLDLIMERQEKARLEAENARLEEEANTLRFERDQRLLNLGRVELTVSEKAEIEQKVTREIQLLGYDLDQALAQIDSQTTQAERYSKFTCKLPDLALTMGFRKDNAEHRNIPLLLYLLQIDHKALLSPQSFTAEQWEHWEIFAKSLDNEQRQALLSHLTQDDTLERQDESQFPAKNAINALIETLKEQIDQDSTLQFIQPEDIKIFNKHLLPHLKHLARRKHV
jgi:hypothetical protein